MDDVLSEIKLYIYIYIYIYSGKTYPVLSVHNIIMNG